MASSWRLIVGTASLFALLYFCLGTKGQEEQKKISMEGFPCGKKTLTIATGVGVKEFLIYICENDEVNINPNGHTFKMSFKKNECPFQEGCDDISQTVETKTSITKHQKHFDKITFIKYSVTVDSSKPIDPIIIGGGKPPIE